MLQSISLHMSQRLALRVILVTWNRSVAQQRCSVCSTCLSIAHQAKLKKKLQQQQQLLVQDKGLWTQTRHLKLYQPVQQCVFPEYDIEVNEYMNRKRTQFDMREHWSYRGPQGMQHWASYFRSCQGKFQSPVNLSSFQIQRDAKLTELIFKNFDTVSGVKWLMENNGKTVMVTMKCGDLRVHGGGLFNEYGVWQFHFHWGSSNDWGSEHTVDGRRFPMEMHVVTFNLEYGSVENAVNHSDGLLVLGTFFEISSEDNSQYEPLVRALQHIRGPGNFYNMRPLPLRTLLPHDTQKYYRYHGSLTTPPCSEVVIWTIFGESIPISSTQLEKFRQLSCLEEDEEGRLLPMVDNFRRIQFLEGRKITNNF